MVLVARNKKIRQTYSQEIILMENSESPSLPRGLFTSCPSCLKQFRIQASQLSAAAGQVECGVCSHQFSALARLSDVPLILDEFSYEFDYESAQKPLAVSLPEAEAEPEFDIPAFLSEKEGIANEVQYEAAESDNSVADEEALLNEFPKDILGDLPDELREESPAKRSLLATISWGLGAALLLIIIIAQLAWFNRDELLLRYPQLELVARKVCERLQCETLRHKDISLIKLLNRDVRNHPLYEGNLLVNATMANKSETIQQFPVIQLALFNTGGEVIGYREFKPQEYLDDSINIQAGMLPESPIHFVLEVSGPTKDAVSFEFHFL
jgi:predicted Zn finger-like uncharacterized protein